MARESGVARRLFRPSWRGVKLIKRFRKNDEGATAVEFALVSIPFLGLLFAIFETAFVFFVTQGVEAAVNDAARYIMTGQVQHNATITNMATFRNEIVCQPTTKPRVLPSFIKCEDIKIDIRPAPTPEDFTSADIDKNFLLNANETFCTGKPSQIMVVRILYPMPVYLSILSMKSMSYQDTIVNDSGVDKTNYKGNNRWHMIMGTAVFKNEPFPEQNMVSLSGC